MRLSISVKFLCVVAAFALMASRATHAQEPSFRNPTAADKLSDFVRDKKIAAADLEQLSRLLTDPHDQINWLVQTGESLQVRGDDDVARDAAERADARMTIWITRGVPFPADDPVARRLAQLIAAIKPIFEIVDPAKLLDRLRKTPPTELEALSDEAKFLLFSRGIADPYLPDSKQTLYGTALLVGDTIASGRNLPTVTRLLDAANILATMPAMPVGALEDAVAAKDCVSALLDRSLGVDAFDRGNSEWGRPEFWAQKAEAFKQKNLWRWEALARILEASTASDTDARRRAAITGKEAWAKFHQVTSSLSNVGSAWSGVDTWLERLDRDPIDQLELAADLPLSPDFRMRGRMARRDYESQFLAARREGRDEDAFRFMQLAKASDITLAGAVAPGALPTIEYLKALFGEDRGGRVSPRDVHVFMEIIEIARDGGQPTFHAMALRVVTGGMDITDDYRVEWFMDLTSPMQAVERALAWMPQGFAGARFIVALDGEWRGRKWLDAESLLCSRINVNDSRSWLYYLPSASALKKGGPWQLQPTIRTWYASLVRSGAFALMSAVAERGDVPLAKETSPVAASETYLTAVHLDKDYGRAIRGGPRGGWARFSQHIVSLKSGEARNTIPIIVSRP